MRWNQAPASRIAPEVSSAWSRNQYSSLCHEVGVVLRVRVGEASLPAIQGIPFLDEPRPGGLHHLHGLGAVRDEEPQEHRVGVLDHRPRIADDGRGGRFAQVADKVRLGIEGYRYGLWCFFGCGGEDKGNAGCANGENAFHGWQLKTSMKIMADFRQKD